MKPLTEALRQGIDKIRRLDMSLSGVDRRLLLRDLTVDRLGLQHHQHLAGRDVRALVNQNPDDASADERPYVDGSRFQRPGRCQLLRLASRPQIQQHCDDHEQQGGDRQRDAQT